MSIRVKISAANFDRMMGDLVDLSEAADQAIERTANFLVQSTAQRAKNNIRSGPATGRVYRRYNPFRIHQASSPGEYPMEDLGTLANSIHYTKWTKFGGQATVGSSLIYALYLEFGTSKMAARPWLRPSFRDATESAGEVLKKMLRDQL